MFNAPNSRNITYDIYFPFLQNLLNRSTNQMLCLFCFKSNNMTAPFKAPIKISKNHNEVLIF